MAVQPHSPGAFTFQPKHSRGIMSCAYLCHTSFTSSEARRLSCWSRHGFDVGNEVPLPNWDWLEQTGYMCYIIYIYIYMCVCTYIYLYIRPAKILLVCVSVFQASRVSRLCCLRHASWICDVNYMSVYLYSIQIKFSARPKMTTRHPLLNKCWLSRSHDPESEESHHPISPHVTTMSLQKVL